MLAACLILALLAPALADAGAAGPAPGAETSPPPGNVSITVKDASVREVLRMVAKAAGANLIVSDGVGGKAVSVDIRDVPFEDALTILGQANGFRWRKLGDVYIITPVAGGAANAAPAPGPPGPYMVVERIPLKFVSAARVADSFRKPPVAAAPQPDAPPPVPPAALPLVAAAVSRALNESFLGLPIPAVGDPVPTLKDAPVCVGQGPASPQNPAGMPLVFDPPQPGGNFCQLLPDGMSSAIVVDEPLNALIVCGTREALDQFKELVALLDQPIKQVELSLKWVQVDPPLDAAFGVNLGTDPAPVSFRLANGHFTEALRKLLNEGRAQVLGETRALAPNNRGAVVLQGAISRAYVRGGLPGHDGLYAPRADFAGLTLLLTPRVNKDDTVTVDLHALLAATDKSLALPVELAAPEGLHTADLLQLQVTISDNETLMILPELPLPSEVRARLADPGAPGARADHRPVVLLITPHVVRMLPEDWKGGPAPPAGLPGGPVLPGGVVPLHQ
jgi:type II secretory pathway component GspD/PulD (secretin)